MLKSCQTALECSEKCPSIMQIAYETSNNFPLSYAKSNFICVQSSVYSLGIRSIDMDLWHPDVLSHKRTIKNRMCERTRCIVMGGFSHHMHGMGMSVSRNDYLHGIATHSPSVLVFDSSHLWRIWLGIEQKYSMYYNFIEKSLLGKNM